MGPLKRRANGRRGRGRGCDRPDGSSEDGEPGPDDPPPGPAGPEPAIVAPLLGLGRFRGLSLVDRPSLGGPCRGLLPALLGESCDLRPGPGRLIRPHPSTSEEDQSLPPMVGLLREPHPVDEDVPERLVRLDMARVSVEDLLPDPLRLRVKALLRCELGGLRATLDGVAEAKAHQRQGLERVVGVLDPGHLRGQHPDFPAIHPNDDLVALPAGRASKLATVGEVHHVGEAWAGGRRRESDQDSDDRAHRAHRGGLEARRQPVVAHCALPRALGVR